jgi:hypothetical protein
VFLTFSYYEENEVNEVNSLFSSCTSFSSYTLNPAQVPTGGVTMRKWTPAPPDPGIKPGGIRDRAMQAVLARGPRLEDEERTRASQEHWARYQAEQAERAGRSEIDQRPPGAGSEAAGMRWCEARKAREEPQGYEENEVDEEMPPQVASPPASKTQRRATNPGAEGSKSHDPP